MSTVQAYRKLQAKVEMLRTNLEAARTEAAAAESLRREVATLRSQLTAGSSDMVAAVAEAAGGISEGDAHVQALQQELAQVSASLVKVVQQAAGAYVPKRFTLILRRPSTASQQGHHCSVCTVCYTVDVAVHRSLAELAAMMKWPPRRRPRWRTRS